MSRTISDIQTELQDEFMHNATLQRLYGFTADDSFTAKFNTVSIESLLLYIVASAIYTLEVVFDQHTAEVEAIVAEQKAHTARWYVNKAKAFLYGQPLIDGTDGYDTTSLTADEIAAAQIVTFAAVTEDSATLHLKVAKSGPAPLTDDELAAFTAYMAEVKDAGVRLNIVSQAGDYLKLRLEIIYDPMLLSADGLSTANGAAVVRNAIKAYIEGLPYNGELRINAMVDAIQAVSGVVMVHPVSAQYSETGSTWQSVGNRCTPASGYFDFSLADIEITYSPN
ncbi:MAG: hypothetical protein E7070_05245 [Bacteroidales bacterium]|nr:hypothetical protein [Bacteroidales bacterium]